MVALSTRELVDINLMDGRGEGNGGQRREREPKEGRRDKPPETSAPSDSRREERERGIVQLEQQTQSEKRKRKRENVRVSVDVDEVLELVEVVHGLMRSERKSRPTRAKSTNQAISVPRRPNFRSGRERERERERGRNSLHLRTSPIRSVPEPISLSPLALQRSSSELDIKEPLVPISKPDP